MAPARTATKGRMMKPEAIVPTSSSSPTTRSAVRGMPTSSSVSRSAASRADRSAGVPDPGPAYWDRFNARVMEHVDLACEAGIALKTGVVEILDRLDALENFIQSTTEDSYDR